MADQSDPTSGRTCSIEGCTKKLFCRGWCSAHYSKWQRHGDPLYVGRSSPLAPDATDKRCPKCSAIKPLTEFRKRRKGGAYAGWCKGCEAAYAQSDHGRERHRKARAGWNARSHEYFLTYRYGITLADYEALLATQGGRCAICGTDRPGGNLTKWSVDHCHDSTKVRGLLCAACNMGIGQLGDDPARLRAAAEYIEQHR